MPNLKRKRQQQLHGEKEQQPLPQQQSVLPNTTAPNQHPPEYDSPAQDDSESEEQRNSSTKRPCLASDDSASTFGWKSSSGDTVSFKINTPPQDRQIRIYCDGVHMRQLEQAKKAFENVFLLVGVPNDQETHTRKGLTVLNDKERAETVRHCKWVDEVIEDAPWIITPEFIEEHNIDYVAHDDLPYPGGDVTDIYKPVKDMGKFLPTQRTNGVSTSDIITRIVRDYDEYVVRNLKRGVDRKSLNISLFKKNELDFKRHVSDLRRQIKDNWTTAGRDIRDDLKVLWSPHPHHHSALLREDDQEDPPSPRSEFINGFAAGIFGGVRGWIRKAAKAEGSVRGTPGVSPSPSPENSKKIALSVARGGSSASEAIAET
ncbi:putative choline-phosphate cytidylyltransferase [Neolecta irregularis DAH-3]|uniref:choline-phosphate cytidylyltransferase n=1 Tax=Neolecta irregularis (strain DAH-3) TaxID=1198029 RepID=A0A1U7LHI6_NEOID|nr:putative choline-phosphate cytidylyltransferase [Neolecta irregularis DAH-3]|eukprot:OLL22109.1 putative choline-phosphate cytidylyltransferase [Neolecta irregularis DAH-3]